MTDLEVMQRAKMYMDKLANGINPLNDSPVPEGELLNNVRLCRCFFYVSDVLRQVIDNGGQVGRAAKTPKVPFAITREQLDAFPFSDKPIPVSEIARRISELVPEVLNDTMSKFKYSAITAFLLEYLWHNGIPESCRANWRKLQSELEKVAELRPDGFCNFLGQLGVSVRVARTGQKTLQVSSSSYILVSV